MNEHEIESLLAGLTPRAPSAALVRQVEHELELDRQWLHEDTTRRSVRWQMPMLWAALGASAAAVVMTIWAPGLTESPSTRNTTLAATQTPATAVSAPPTVMPVATIREVVGAQNEGIHYNATSRLPEQHLRLMSVERHAWIDPRDGAQITLERPREDSVVLPVSFQ